MKSQQASEYLRIPLAIPMGSMFIGMLLMLVHYVELLFREISALSLIFKNKNVDEVSNEII
jgi:TRAP-type C4-dicarboxylate transport system permease small subunit